MKLKSRYRHNSSYSNGFESGQGDGQENMDPEDFWRER